MEFHECLVKIMEEKGINQAQLCKLSGIATSAMSHYVRGETEPSFTKVIAIAKALNVSVDDLAGKPKPFAALSPDERELVRLCRSMSQDDRETLLKTARSFAALTGVDRIGSERAVGRSMR